MLSPKKPTAVLYLRRQAVILVDKTEVSKFDLSLEVTQYLEVNDAKKLDNIIAEALKNKAYNNRRVLMVLDNDIVFQKILPANSDTAAAYQAFLEKLPFKPEHRQLITEQDKDGQTHLYGVNSNLYQTVVSGIQQANKIVAVVPAAVYRRAQPGKNISRATIDAFFSDRKALGRANFLSS